jgi:hypothetical protein
LSTADFDAVRPTVWLENLTTNALQRVAWLQCLNIVDNVGENPSRALLKYSPASYDGEDVIPEDHDYDAARPGPGPTALALLANEADDELLIAGQRVVITEEYDGTSPLFVGMLMNRMDTSDPDSLVWECVDDSWIIGGAGGITIRGALIASDNPSGDPNQEIQFCSSYMPVFNPGGNYNCIGANIANSALGIAGNGVMLVPVFSPHVQERKTWDETPPALAPGVLTAWTPRLALEYLYMYLSIRDDATLWGISGSTTWRTTNPSAGNPRVVLDITDIQDNLHALDPNNAAIDFADKRISELTVQGKKGILAISDVLRSLGTHFFTLSRSFDLLTPGPDYGQSVGSIRQKAYKDAYTNSTDIVIPQSGNVADYYDGANGTQICSNFMLSDKSEDAAEATLIEGDSVELEAKYTFNAANGTWSTSQILPAWSTTQQTAFLTIVNGGPSTTAANQPYAVYPPNPDQVTYVDPSAGNSAAWIYANPSNGIEGAKRRTKEAAALARKIYPNVFRAFRIYPTATQLEGYNSAFSGQDYPRLLIARAANQKQGQVIIRPAGTDGAGDYESEIISELPIRLKVYATDDDGVNKWFDAAAEFDYGVDNSGILTIKGLAEEADGAKYCLYHGSIYRTPFTTGLRTFTINAVVKLDHRVSGYFDNTANSPIFSQSLRDSMGGVPMQYIDAGQSYREVHQVASEPSPFEFFQDTTGDTIGSPITRILPPNNGRDLALQAAKRRAYWISRAKKDGKWVLPGIRTQYTAGLWIDNILIGGNPAQTTYTVAAPIQTVTWDFETNQTEIGGLIQDDQR